MERILIFVGWGEDNKKQQPCNQTSLLFYFILFKLSLVCILPYPRSFVLDTNPVWSALVFLSFSCIAEALGLLEEHRCMRSARCIQMKTSMCWLLDL